MNIELACLPDGRVSLVTDTPFSARIKRVEYYGDQKLLMLIYDQPGHEGELMHYELNDEGVRLIENNAKMIIVTAEKGREINGYDVPLIRVGI